MEPIKLQSYRFQANKSPTRTSPLRYSAELKLLREMN